MSSGECSLPVTICVCFLYSIIFLPMASVVVRDYNVQESWQLAQCDGRSVRNAHLHVGLICSSGTATVQLAGDRNETFVNLFYPPGNSDILCQDSSKIKAWISSLGTSQTFDCMLENPSQKVTRGILANIEKIGLWYFGLVVCCLPWFFGLCFCLVYLFIWAKRSLRH
jgi:hypothetical protein